MTHIIVLFLSVITLSAFAQDVKATLTNLVNEFLSKVDKKEMHDRFWAEDLIYTSSSGKRFGKSTIMEGFNEESTTDNDKADGPTYTAEDMQIQVYDSSAIVAFKLVSVAADGARTEFLDSGTFLKRKGQWAVVNWQATKIPIE